MPFIRGRTLVLVIQAVDKEIHRLRRLSDAEAGPDDEVRLVDFETAAEELDDLYEEALAVEKGLPAYEELVQTDG